MKHVNQPEQNCGTGEHNVNPPLPLAVGERRLSRHLCICGDSLPAGWEISLLLWFDMIVLIYIQVKHKISSWNRVNTSKWSSSMENIYDTKS